jgi:hypothetical protein
MAWAGSARSLPALLISRLWFNCRMFSCQVDGPDAIPGSRTILNEEGRMKNEELLRRAPACAVGSPKPDGLGAAPRRRAKWQHGGKQAGFLHSSFFLLHFLLRAAGGNPAILTNFKLLPWSNTCGIRLLNGTMQVGLLFAKRTSLVGDLTCRAWKAKSVQVRSRMPGDPTQVVRVAQLDQSATMRRWRSQVRFLRCLDDHLAGT